MYLQELVSRFIVPPQHNPSASAGSYSSARFRAQHLKNLPETLGTDHARSVCKPFHRASLLSTVHCTRPATFLQHLLFWMFQRKTSRELCCQLEIFLITIIPPAHSNFLPRRAYSITNRPQSTLLRQHLAHAITACASTLPIKHQTNAQRIPRNKYLI